MFRFFHPGDNGLNLKMPNFRLIVKIWIGYKWSSELWAKYFSDARCFLYVSDPAWSERIKIIRRSILPSFRGKNRELASWRCKLRHANWLLKSANSFWETLENRKRSNSRLTSKFLNRSSNTLHHLIRDKFEKTDLPRSRHPTVGTEAVNSFLGIC